MGCDRAVVKYSGTKGASMRNNGFLRFVARVCLALGGVGAALAHQANAEPPVAECPQPEVLTAFHRQVSLPLGRQNSAAFVIPKGKQLVIEYVSASANLPFGQNLLVTIETVVNGESALHALVPARPDYARLTATDGDVVRLRQWLRAYADGGTEVKVSVVRTGNWGSGSAWVTVSGYLVPR
jgi:hypothetical protein